MKDIDDLLFDNDDHLIFLSAFVSSLRRLKLFNMRPGGSFFLMSYECIFLIFCVEVIRTIKKINHGLKDFEKLLFVVIETEMYHFFSNDQYLISETILFVLPRSLNTFHIFEEINGELFELNENRLNLNIRFRNSALGLNNFLPDSG